MPTIPGIPGPYRFFFRSFDCVEPRHIHVRRERMHCKFWLNPLRLATNRGFSVRELAIVQTYIEEHESKIRGTWDAHCARRA